MNIIDNKKEYSAPEMQIIELDKDISLALESDPEGEPGDWTNNQEKFKIDPYNNLG